MNWQLDSEQSNKLFLPTDLFLVTYPKSGTTWMQYTLCLLIAPEMANKMGHISDVFPTLYDRTSRPEHGLGMYKSHLKCSELPKQCKKIYISRDPKDVCVSYYKHVGMKSESMDSFIEKFILGDVTFGSWRNHVIDSKAATNTLCLKYEEMINDYDGVLTKLSVFLGIALDDERRQTIKKMTSFDQMKLRPEVFTPKQMDRQFFNTGKIGIWKEHLSPEQAGLIDKAFRKP